MITIIDIKYNMYLRYFLVETTKEIGWNIFDQTYSRKTEMDERGSMFSS